MSLEAHPHLPEFEYMRPPSLAEASRFLAEHPSEARPMLGGTDMFVRMRDGHWCPKYLVDVKHLDGTDNLAFDPTAGLTVGAAVNMNRVIDFPAVRQTYPVLAEAAQSVASYQLRNRATIVGNICNASPAGDTIGACLVYDGVLNVYNADGFREIPLAGFFTGPGKNVLKSGDIVTSIRLPIPPKHGTGTYLKLGRNKLSDLSIVGITALGYPDAAAPSGYRFRLALASVAPVPLVPSKAEQIMADNEINEATLRRAGETAMEACSPIDDVRSSARYRKLMVRNLTYRALVQVWDQLNQRGS
jgi:carbon-monoxide dehydrogenase medium subunit